jgi:hypothetical protein
MLPTVGANVVGRLVRGNTVGENEVGACVGRLVGRLVG